LGYRSKTSIASMTRPAATSEMVIVDLTSKGKVEKQCSLAMLQLWRGFSLTWFKTPSNGVRLIERVCKAMRYRCMGLLKRGHTLAARLLGFRMWHNDQMGCFQR